MSKDNSGRTPAPQLLKEFLTKNKLQFFIRRQTIRYLEDNAMLIEAPVVVVYYKDQVKAAKGEKKVDLPAAKK